MKDQDLTILTIIENSHSLLIKNGATLDKFDAWVNVVLRQDIKLTNFVIKHSDIDDCNGYLDSLIVLSSYDVKDIFINSIEDTTQKEIYTQLFQNISPKMYLKIFKLLVSTDVDLNAKNGYGHTFLMSAIIHNNITCRTPFTNIASLVYRSN